jgi:SulP family sulfate permease
MESYLRIIGYGYKIMRFLTELFPSRADYSGIKKSWRRDLLAGITVGIVALPLALAFGITSGAGAQAGLITAIFGGLVAAIFGGSKFQVSGPTGAMTVVLVPIIAKYGIASLAPLGIIAGIIIILAGIFHAGNLINRTPWTVMEGFTLGISMVIGLQQIPIALDFPKAHGTRTANVAYDTIRNAVHSGLHWNAIFIVVLTLTVKFTYPRLARRLKIKLHIPASFLAIVVSTLVVLIFKLKLSTVGSLPSRIFNLKAISFTALPLSALIIAAIEIALLGAIESLLSARVADQMAHIKSPEEKYHPNRELVGQGLGTLFASLLGGMPATGAIARTSVNVRSGGKTRMAAILHAIFLIAVVLLLSPIISRVPTAALAGVLIGVSYRIASPANLLELLKTTKLNISTIVVTSMSVLFIDLIWGIIIGSIYYNIVLVISKRLQWKQQDHSRTNVG